MNGIWHAAEYPAARRVARSRIGRTVAMSWAVAMEGRTDLGGIVFVIEEREEAESIASEIRSRGTQVVVYSYPQRDGTGGPSVQP